MLKAADTGGAADASNGGDGGGGERGPYARYDSPLIRVRSDFENGVESRAELRFGGEDVLRIELTMEPDEIEPLFSGAAWAGTTIWPASVLLAEVLLQLRASPYGPLRGRSVIELGAGVGVPGFVAARLGARVTVTEQAQLLRLLEKNGAKNFGAAPPLVQHLDWSAASARALVDRLRARHPEQLSAAGAAGDAGGAGFDLVIASDVVYEPLYGDSWVPLAETLEALLRPPAGREPQGAPVALVSCERRNHDGIGAFLGRLRELGLEATVVRSEAEGMLLVHAIQHCDASASRSLAALFAPDGARPSRP